MRRRALSRQQPGRLLGYVACHTIYRQLPCPESGLRLSHHSLATGGPWSRAHTFTPFTVNCRVLDQDSISSPIHWQLPAPGSGVGLSNHSLATAGPWIRARTLQPFTGNCLHLDQVLDSRTPFTGNCLLLDQESDSHTIHCQLPGPGSGVGLSHTTLATACSWIRSRTLAHFTGNCLHLDQESDSHTLHWQHATPGSGVGLSHTSMATAGTWITCRTLTPFAVNCRALDQGSDWHHTRSQLPRPDPFPSVRLHQVLSHRCDASPGQYYRRQSQHRRFLPIAFMVDIGLPLLDRSPAIALAASGPAGAQTSYLQSVRTNFADPASGHATVPRLRSSRPRGICVAEGAQHVPPIT